MKFVLEVDIPSSGPSETTVRELSRVLRYWGGNLHHYTLAPGVGEAVYDSAFQEVGRWTITETPPSP
ncbi:hypothetical protein ACIP88_04005 [Streptomyces uncialis]|uniref:hypothetical protein n=1 Tax=Streptomyces uncialis TaxID=1048205 RepID=UPI003818A364